MSPATSTPVDAAPVATAAASPRVSLACMPCRDRHVRCGAERPQCERCAAADRACYYTKSRRGGLDRATLAARRKRRAEAELAASAKAVEPAEPPRQELGFLHFTAQSSSSPATDGGLGQQQQQQQAPVLFESGDQQPPFGLLDPSPFGNAATASDPGCLRTDSPEPPGLDALLDLYYLHFHRLHPFVVPRARLDQLLGDPTLAVEMKPVAAAMRYVGSLYSRSRRQPWSNRQLLELAQAAADSEAQGHLAPSPFLVQSRLLLSIALYWSDEPAETRTLLNSAVGLAVDLGMNRAELATAQGASDPVLAESWRRTWWQLLIVDACIAATDRTLVFWVSTIEATVGLPCEENEYENMTIPPSKTTEDMDSRELELDCHGYSSFAYLVDAYRSASDALAAMPSLTSPSGSFQVLHEIDAILDAWFLLLPESKKDALTEDGQVDELMFQAHMAINTVILTVHRPFSRILFSPLETISTCVVYPSQEPMAKESLIIHTTRCLRAIEGQVRLLTLPTPARRFSQSPFVVCQLATAALPLLSAHRSVLTGPRVAVARNQLRLIIGCLRGLADIWPRVGHHLKELQDLARLMLRPRGAPAGDGAVAALAASAESAPAPAPAPAASTHGTSTRSSSGQGATVSSTAPTPPSLADLAVDDWLVTDVAAAINALPLPETTLWGGREDILPPSSGCDLSLWSTQDVDFPPEGL